MLVELEIRNYAIIEALHIRLGNQLNILTGETGSGKSILLGALGLILGKRVDSKALYQSSAKCVIEGTFDITRYELQSFFAEHDIEYSPRCIVRREITPDGRSRAFVNDTPVNLKVLQELSGQLVDLHEQFDNQGLSDPAQQIMMLDAIAGSRSSSDQYRQLYQQYKLTLATLEGLQQQRANSLKEVDFVRFQSDEIAALQLRVPDDEDLEARLQALVHADEIRHTLQLTVHQIEEHDNSLLVQMKALQRGLDHAGQYNAPTHALAERLQQLLIELEDLAYEAGQLSEQIETSPAELEALQRRHDKINSLLHKHQVREVAALVALQQAFELQLERFVQVDDKIAVAEQRIEELGRQLGAMALELRSMRKAAVASFDARVNSLLKQLKMEHAHFKIQIEEDEQLKDHGYDHIHFLFAPNKGSGYFLIKEVASGGELARLSLISKSLVAETLSMPTLVFDEIDSGVSGDVAMRMGELLSNLAKQHQVLSITHSPQVAARADTHFSVYKQASGALTTTHVDELSVEQRVVEVATMLSSSPPTETALASAREMMGLVKR